MSKTLHIIPHSHWDREWYMSFEEHRFRLVELIDSIIETLETTPDFKYYHLDGQFIVIEDYLEIKPYMKERLFKLIKDDRLQIGPWYVLQDEYLTSAEANVRNMLYGLKLCREIGAKPVMTGYFPDTFGNISQIPQILNGFDIKTAVFGRGLNELGSNNTVVKQNGMNKSEIVWQSPDKSQVVGVMFANWYHNAMELPVVEEIAKERTAEIIKSTSTFVATPHLLGMNGCDHQPLQKNVYDAIKLMNKFSGDVEVKISNFKDYLSEIEKYKDELRVVEGEIAGQYTSGFYLLINTASARVYLKQKNYEAQNILERVAEPLNALSFLYNDSYKNDFLFHSWKILLSNHAHDSICGCSVDEVHTEMMTRFEKSIQISKTVAEKSLQYLALNVDTSEFGEKSILVFNKQPFAVTDVVVCNIDFDMDEEINSLSVIDKNGNEVDIDPKIERKTFTYTLPDDSFRKVKYVDRFIVSFVAKDVPALGFDAYQVVKNGGKEQNKFIYDENSAENEFFSLTVEENGSLTVINKENGKVFRGLNSFESVGDAGNEYEYLTPEQSAVTTTKNDKAKVEIAHVTPYNITFKITNTLEISTDCNEKLQSEKKVMHEIISLVTLTKGVERIDITMTIDNKANDFRLRAMFETDIKTDVVYADSQFDVVTRNIKPWHEWKNPSNTQRMGSFFELNDENDGLIVASKGLHEYEVIGDRNVMALTLLRCVGQLGDWGVFKTPDAQCHGVRTASYSVIPFKKEKRAVAHKSACIFAESSLIAVETANHTGKIKAGVSGINIEGDYIRMTALKKSEHNDSLIFRIYNSSDKEQNAVISFPEEIKNIYQTNLEEKRESQEILVNAKLSITIPAKKIISLELCK